MSPRQNFADQFSELLEFFYLLPIGVIKFKGEGSVELINPESSGLLMPLIGNAGLNNIYITLRELMPDLAKVVANSSESLGVLVDQGHPTAGVANHVVSLSLTVARVREDTYLAAIEDVSRMSDLLTRLTRSNTELESFAYVASHDMQEPVRMMLSFTQLLERDYHNVLDAEGRQYLSIIESSALRVRNMIRDLLDYARLEGGSGDFGPVDMRLKWDMAADNLHQLIAETKAVITCDDLPVVNANAIQVTRILQNLLQNAVKFQPPGQLPLVHLGVTQEADGPVFYVRDNGIGIKPEFVEQIFEPFRRLLTWDAIPGSGLGLSICRKIIERHGGKIWAVSSPGAGTTIYFKLR